MGYVNMAAEYEVNPHTACCIEQRLTAVRRIVGNEAFQFDQMMVKHQDLEQVRRTCAKEGFDLFHDAPSDPAAFDRPTVCGVDAQHRNVVRLKPIEVVDAEKTIVPMQRPKQPAQWSPPGVHVVISRYHDDRNPEPCQHVSRQAKLPGEGTLRQIAADGNERYTGIVDIP